MITGSTTTHTTTTEENEMARYGTTRYGMFTSPGNAEVAGAVRYYCEGDGERVWGDTPPVLGYQDEDGASKVGINTRFIDQIQAAVSCANFGEVYDTVVRENLYEAVAEWAKVRFGYEVQTSHPVIQPAWSVA